MKPRMEAQRIKRTKWYEYLIRFVFGGLITMMTGVIARKYGPGVGGLFLAFPAILPASATLIEKHSGRRAAGVDAAGAALGTVGLAAFGLIVWKAGPSTSPWVVLPLATVVWFVVGSGLWVAREAWKHVRYPRKSITAHHESGPSRA